LPKAAKTLRSQSRLLFSLVRRLTDSLGQEAVGKLPNALSSPWPGKTYVPTSSVRRCSRYSTIGNPIGRSNWADGFSFFTVFEPQTARFGVRLGPLQADHFAATAAGQRDLANDIRRHRVPLLLGGFAQHLAQRPILRFGQSPLSHVVLWLAETVRRIGRDDPSLGGILIEAAENSKLSYRFSIDIPEAIPVGRLRLAREIGPNAEVSIDKRGTVRVMAGSVTALSNALNVLNYMFDLGLDKEEVEFKTTVKADRR
jgi:hypothetical protein